MRVSTRTQHARSTRAFSTRIQHARLTRAHGCNRHLLPARVPGARHLPLLVRRHLRPPRVRRLSVFPSLRPPPPLALSLSLPIYLSLPPTLHLSFSLHLTFFSLSLAPHNLTPISFTLALSLSSTRVRQPCLSLYIYIYVCMYVCMYVFMKT
jgi:hypothetical protein